MQTRQSPPLTLQPVRVLLNDAWQECQHHNTVLLEIYIPTNKKDISVLIS